MSREAMRVPLAPEAQAKRLADHLDCVAQLRKIVRRQRPIRQGRDFCRDAVLPVRVAAQ